MACTILFSKLLEISQNESKAKELYSYFETEEFKKVFYGNQTPQNNPEYFAGRINDQFEPLLYLNKALNRHYFLDKDNEPVYYPYHETGLKDFLNSNDIKDLAKSIAYAFYIENLNLDTNTFEITNKSKESLTSFIFNEINKISKDLKNSKNFIDVFTSNNLNKTKYYLDEWYNEVVDVFNKHKLDIIEEEMSEMEQQEEEIRGEVVRKESFLKSSKLNVKENIKLFLSFIPSTKLNKFKRETFEEFDDVYNTLTDALHDVVIIPDENLNDAFEKYLNIIENLSERKEYLKILLDNLDLKKEDDIFKAQFVNAFSLTKNNYLTSEYSKGEKGGLTHTVKNVSEVTSLKSGIIDQWFYNFKTLDLNEDALKKINLRINNLISEFGKNTNKINNEEQLEKYHNSLLEILNSLGVTQINQKAYDYFLDGFEKNTSFETRKDNFLKLLTSVNRIFDNKKKDSNLFKDQKIIKDLAKAQAFFVPNGSDASIFSLGKSKWVYSLPSFLITKINQWKESPELLEKHLESSFFNQSSYWGKYLLALDVEQENQKSIRQERLNNLELFIFNSVQKSNQSFEGLESKEMGFTDALADYLNKLLAFKTGKKSYHKTALAADKSTEYQLSLGNEVMINTNARYSSSSENNVIFNDAALEVFYEYFKSEYQRIGYEIKKAKSLNPEELTSNYNSGNKNAFQSQLFPSLAPVYEKGKLISVPKNLGFELYTSKGEPVFTDLDIIKDRIKQEIAGIVSRNIITTLDNLIQSEIFRYDLKGNLENNALDVNVFNQYLKDAGNNKKLAMLKIASDFFINNVISQVEYSKLFTGDTAYYKDVIDYKKRVPATYTDGQYLYLNNVEDLNFNIAVISSIEGSVPYYQELKELLGEEIADKYLNDVNIADAQAWITPERWKFLMQKLGKWNNVYESAYNKMNNDNNTKIFTKDELKVLGQPLKGVYFNNDNGVPVFLKYSQGVLWKPLIKNTGLQTLYDKMTIDENGNTLSYNEQIHELITKDGIKVGSLTPVKSHDNNNNVLSFNEFSLNNKIVLSNQYWKLQQDLPTKNLHDTQIGSQIQKIIFQGLVYNQNETFEVEGKSIKGNNLIKELHSLMSELSNKGYNKIINKLGIDPTTFKIEDEHQMYNSLIQQLSKRKDVPDNFINALKANLSPYGIPGSINMFNNVFSSFVNDSIIKIKTNGGGFIQMSDYGIYKDTLKDQKIIFTPWMTTNKLPSPGIYTDENGKKHLKPGGIFISGSLIAKYIPDYTKYSAKELFEGDENTKPIIDPEFLRNVIGYRIPNQGLSSNDSFEILGILPEAMGDTIIPYTGITKKTGSDFDIDKMYIMIPSVKKIRRNGLELFKQTEITNAIAKKILKNEGISNTNNPVLDLYEYLIGLDEFDYNENNSYLFNQNPELKQLLNTIDNFLKESPVKRIEYIQPKTDINNNELPISEQPESVIQNKLIKSFKAILEHPKVLQSVMQPLDGDKISNDIKNLHPEQKRSDMMDFDALSDLRLKGDFALGKAGLGQNVNSLVDAVRGAMSQLKMINYSFGEKTTGENQEINFDKEFSFKLSKKDIEEYVKSYNSNEKDPKKHIKLKEALNELSEIKLFDAMMELVNGFVDIAKDPFIVRGNWVTQTNNVGFFMLRAGVHPFYINAFLGQPILKQYMQYLSNKESKVIDDSADLIDKFKLNTAADLLKNETIEFNGFSLQGSDLFKSVITYEKAKNLIYQYNSKNIDFEKITKELQFLKNTVKDTVKGKFNIKGIPTEFEKQKIEEISTKLINQLEFVYNLDNNLSFDQISLKTLRDNILESQDIQVQLSVFNHFLKLQKNHSKKLTKSVKSAKIDVNGKGKNVTSTIVNINTIETFMNPDLTKEDSILIGGETKMTFDENSTFLNSYYENVKKIFKVMQNNPKYFLTAKPEIVNTFNLISEMIYQEPLQREELGDLLEKTFYSYVMSSFKPLKEGVDNNIEILVSTVKELNSKKNKYPNNFLLQSLTTSIGQGVNYVTLPNNKISVHDKNKIVDAWKELLRLDPEYAEKLIKYSFIVTGFNQSPNVLYQYIPYEWFNKNRFNSHLKTIDFNTIEFNFIDQFFRHNLSNRTLVKRTFVNSKNQIAVSGTTFDTAFTSNKNLGYYTYIVSEQEEEVDDFMLSFDEYSPENKEKYYKLSGVKRDSNGNIVTYIYTRIKPLGYRDKKGNRIFEYDLNKTNKESSLNTNKITPSLNERYVEKHIPLILKSKDMSLDIYPKLNDVTNNIQTSNLNNNIVELTKEEFNNLTEEEKATIEWQKKNC